MHAHTRSHTRSQVHTCASYSGALTQLLQASRNWTWMKRAPAPRQVECAFLSEALFTLTVWRDPFFRREELATVKARKEPRL